MFEKFTEKAINVITEAQNQAKIMQNAQLQPEHLLLAIVEQSKGIPLKLFRMYGVTFEKVKEQVEKKLRFEKSEKELATVPFSEDFKNLLKQTLDIAAKSENNTVLFEHLFLAVITDELSYTTRILTGLKFDINNAKEILSKLVQKKIKKHLHPEIEDTKEPEQATVDTEGLFEDESAAIIFNTAVEKLSQSNYEILGTEQIISAILAHQDFDVSKTLAQFGINPDVFNEKLSQISSRTAEYDDQRVVFTPAAFMLVDLASQTAKELGSPSIKPEHIILGLLKSKKGVAYDIIKSLNANEDSLSEEIMKPIEKQMPQALTVLKLAKQEARRLGRSVVGTEMILLGIINEGTGIGFKVLNDLDITLKNIREIIEKTIGYGNEYYDTEIIFTRRAKRVLEVAWQKAKKYNRPRIMSEHLLYAITTEASSVAMKALEQLGVDAVEIRQGILKEIE